MLRSYKSNLENALMSWLQSQRHSVSCKLDLLVGLDQVYPHFLRPYMLAQIHDLNLHLVLFLWRRDCFISESLLLCAHEVAFSTNILHYRSHLNRTPLVVRILPYFSSIFEELDHTLHPYLHLLIHSSLFLFLGDYYSPRLHCPSFSPLQD